MKTNQPFRATLHWTLSLSQYLRFSFVIGLLMILLRLGAVAQAPTLTGSAPNDNATGYFIFPKYIALWFSENLYRVPSTTGSVKIYKTGDASPLYDINVIDALITEGEDYIYLYFDTGFDPLTSYHITIDPGTFEDSEGNDFAGFTDATTLNFTTGTLEDELSAFSFSPSKGETNISVDLEYIEITFDEEILGGADSYYRLRKSSDNSLVKEWVTDDDITFYEESQIFYARMPLTDVTLEEGTSYYIDNRYNDDSEVEEGLIEYSGLGDAIDETYITVRIPSWGNDYWTFTTAANPSIVSTSPTFGATGIQRQTGIVLNFSEAVNVIADKSITIYRSFDDQLMYTKTTFSAASYSTSWYMSEQISTQLDYNTLYYVLMDAGIFEDVDGNPVAAITDKTVWTFTTVEEVIDTDAPTVNDFETPENGETDFGLYPASFYLYFSEDISLIDETAGVVNLYKADDSLIETYDATGFEIGGGGITINNNVLLEPSTSYYFTFDAGIIEDLAGNDFEGFSDKDTWGFTTRSQLDEDNTFVSGITPAASSTNVALDLDMLEVNFNEVLTLVNGFIRLKNASNDVVKEWDLSSTIDLEIVDGIQLQLSGIATLDYSTAYHVSVEGITEGSHPNAFEAGDLGRYSGWDDSFWTFTTIEEPLSIVSTSPANGAIGVVLDATYSITFNKPVFSTGGGEFNFKLVSNEQIDGVSSYFPTFSSFDGYTVSFNRANNLSNYGTEYFVYIEDAIQDGQGHVFSDLANDTWRFTTITEDEANRPLVDNYSPENGAESVELFYGYIKLTMDREVELNNDAQGKVLVKRYEDNEVVREYAVGECYVYTPEGYSNIEIIMDFEFDPLTTYYIEIGDDLFYTVGTTSYFPGISGNDGWSFTTESQEESEAIYNSFSPARGAIDLAPNTNEISITFNEDAFYSNTSLKLKKSGSGDLVKEWEWSSDYTTDNRTFVFGDLVLEANTSYYVEHTTEGSVVTFVTSNFNVPSWADDFWTFTTGSIPDTQAPVVSSFSPVNNALQVDLNSDLTITFDEDIKLTGSGTTQALVIRNLDTDVAEFIFLEPSNINGNILTVNYPNLEYGSTYFIVVTTDVISDLSGNVFEGFSANDVWRFTTEAAPDTQSPQIVSFSPANNALEVGLNSDLIMTFDEDIKLTDGGTTKVLVIRNLDTDFAEFIFLEPSDISGNILTVNYPNMTYSSTYFIVLSTDVISDLSGNVFEGFATNDVWRFTIVSSPDTQSPQIVSRSIENGSEIHPSNIPLSITFDESVIRGTGLIQLINSNGNVVVEYPAASSEFIIEDNTWSFPGVTNTTTAGGSYYWLIPSSAITDVSGNEFEGFVNSTDWYFTTYSTYPIVQTVSPISGSNGVSLDTQLTLVFNKEVKKGSGTINLLTFVGHNVVTSWDILDTEVTINGSVVTLAPKITLPVSTQMYVTVSEGSFLDLENDPFISGTLFEGKNWEFTTESESDTEAPQIIAFSPSNGTTNVDINAPFVIIFDEPIRLAGNGATKQLILWSNGSNLIIPLNDETVSIDDAIMTIQHDELEKGTTYYITLSDEIFEDMSGNWFYGGWTANDIWEFTTSSKLGQSIYFASISNKTFGNAPFELSATATSELGVGFSVVSGPISIDGNTVTIRGAGTAVIAANQSGDDSFNSAPQVTISFTIAKANQTITIADIGSKIITDDAFMASAVVDTGLPLTYQVSGPATISGTEITLTNTSGLVTLIVSQVGNDDYNAASKQITFNVNDPSKTDQTITITGIPNKFTNAVPFSVLATTDSNLALTYAVSGPASIEGTTITLSGAEGTVTVTVSQAGDDSFNAAESAVSFEVTEPVVEKQNQTISITAISDKLTTDGSFDVVATTDSNLALTYAVSGPASIEGTTITLFGAEGTVTVIVSQAGDDSFNAAESAVSFEVTEPVVEKQNQTITITAIPNKLSTDGSFDVVATTDSNLALTYAVSGPASIEGTTITLSGAEGTVTVIVSQAGDDSFNAAEASVSFDVILPEVTGVNDLDSFEIAVYPNPTSENVIIRGIKNNHVMASLYDLQGKMVLHEDMITDQLSVAHLNEGLYLLQIKDNNKTTTTRLIIKK